MALLASGRMPDSYRLAVLFEGGHGDLQSFQQFWIDTTDSVDLRASLIEAHPHGVSVVLWPHSTPPPEVLTWWLSAVDLWRVFYREGGRDETATGEFVQWGFVADARPRTEGPPHGLCANGDVIPLAVPAGDLLGDAAIGQVAFTVRGSQRAVVDAARLPAVGRAYGLTIGVVPDTAALTLSGPHFELARVRSRIHQLEQRRERLEYMTMDQSIPVEMRVYRETEDDQLGVGTHWDLRRWFVDAPDEEVAAFVHARIVIEGTNGHGDETLHLVLPASTTRPPDVSLPDAAAKLDLDRNWSRFERSIYTPRGLRLRPAPPPRRTRVLGLLEQALWAEANPKADVLVLLRNRDREIVRVAVPRTNFAPLDQHVEQLNFNVALRPALCKPAGDVVASVLQALNAGLTGAINGHVVAMRETLDEVWSGERADLNVQRQAVNDALALIQEIRGHLLALRQLRDGMKTVVDKDWALWEEFVANVLSLDRQLPPGPKR